MTTQVEAGVRVGLPPGSRLPRPIQTGWYLSEPRGCTRTMRQRHGDLFTMQVMNGTVVMGCTPAHARQVFSADPMLFRPFAVEALGPVLGQDALLLAWGEPHRKQRKLLQPPFHGARMRAYGETISQVAREHIEPLKAGRELRAHDVTAAIALDVIVRAVFGLGEGALSEGREVMGGVLEGFSPLVLFSRQFQTPLFPPWRRLLQAQQRFDALIERLVQRRKASGEEGEDVLGMLLAARWEDGTAMTTTEIRDQLLTLLIAGHETTAISLAWAVHEVYRRPGVLRRLREEIGALGPSPEPEALTRLPYLSAVCDESLRFRPIVTDVVRTLDAPFEYGGWRLPAGVCVGVSIEAIHTDPKLYPDPLSYSPERFLEKKPGPFEFLPFGGGHRRCLGAAFSDFEARIVLGTLVSRLDLMPLLEDQPVRRNVTMGPKRGVPIRVVGHANRS